MIKFNVLSVEPHNIAFGDPELGAAMERLMRSDDLIYYQRRAREERERAGGCTDNTVALAHLKMADEYDKRIVVTATRVVPIRT